MRTFLGCLAIIVVVVAGYGAWCSAESMQGINRIYAEMQNPKRKAALLMQTMTTTWKDAQGVTHTVTTTRGEGETQSAFAQRHKDAVAALQAIYPPVP